MAAITTPTPSPSYISTRFPDGVTNAGPTVAMQNYPAPDPSRLHQFFDDFDSFSNVATTGSALWVTNLTGASTTGVIADADGGVLLMDTASAGATDAFWAQLKGYDATTDVAETFTWESTKRMWFKARFQISDATQSIIRMGLWVTDTSPATITDGIYIYKADDAATMSFGLTASSATTSVNIGTLVSATWTEVAWYYDPRQAAFIVYVNDIPVGRQATLTNAPTTELAVSFGFQNGEAVEKTMSLDYLLVAKER